MKKIDLKSKSGFLELTLENIPSQKYVHLELLLRIHTSQDKKKIQEHYLSKNIKNEKGLVLRSLLSMTTDILN